MAKPQTQTKSAKVIALLGRGNGANIEEICKATKWKPHSVRAFLTGLRKKEYLLNREQRRDGGTIYRITKQPTTDNKANAT